MPERIANGVNGIELCYETFGDPDHEPLLLIMGLGAQMIWWADELCALLADREFHVIRYDNRDCGRSTAMHGRVSLPAAYLRRRAPYALEDLAGDAAGLLETLGAGPAHVVGCSMGGMIAQLLAIRHPERVRSLTSIMSTTGNRLVGRPSTRGAAALLSAPPTERGAYIEHLVRTFRAIGSPGYPFEAERMRDRAARTFDRGVNRAGTARQLAACLAAPDRTRQLRQVRVPTAVIHGAADPLVQLSGGIATGRAVPGAELHVIRGMGHDLPSALWPRYADIIEDRARTASRRAAAD
ncbi:MAG: alpha/beta fold hydrolase [Micromonosporaceae bacterium]